MNILLLFHEVIVCRSFIRLEEKYWVRSENPRGVIQIHRNEKNAMTYLSSIIVGTAKF